MLLFRRSTQTRNNIRHFRRVKFNYVGFVNRRYMEDGAAHIGVQVRNIDDILSPYSTPEAPWLNEDFLSYVEHCANHIPVEESIVLEITGADFTESERTTIVSLLKTHFGFELAEREYDLRQNLRRSFALLIFFAVASLIFFLMAFKFDSVFIEIPAVAMWFALWEFFNTFWLGRSDIKLEKTEAGQLASMQVKFVGSLSGGGEAMQNYP